MPSTWTFDLAVALAVGFATATGSGVLDMDGAIAFDRDVIDLVLLADIEGGAPT